jgi:hypothetical protein
MQSAGKFMFGAAIAYNLKKWMNYEQRNRKTAIMRLKKAQKVFSFGLLVLQPSIVYHSTGYQTKNVRS